MTKKRDLKRRVRARQTSTGEAYVTARRNLIAKRPAGPLAEPPPHAVPVVEFIDVTEAGAALGMKCRVSVLQELAERVDTAALLVRVRDVLAASKGDGDAQLMREVVLGLAGRIEVAQERPPRAAPPTTVHRHFAGIVHRLVQQIGQPGKLAGLRVDPRFISRARAVVGGWSSDGLCLALPVAGKQGLEMVILMLWGVAHQSAERPRPESASPATAAIAALRAEVSSRPAPNNRKLILTTVDSLTASSSK